MVAAHAVTRHEIFQSSLITSLAQGVYEDEMSLAELLGHGSFGIGTFNELDGEMVILGGTCYRLRSDGSVSVPELSERTPYAVVTNFVPTISRPVAGPVTRQEFSRIVDGLVPSSNYMYALRVTGRFAWASARIASGCIGMSTYRSSATTAPPPTKPTSSAGTRLPSATGRCSSRARSHGASRPIVRPTRNPAQATNRNCTAVWVTWIGMSKASGIFVRPSCGMRSSRYG